MRRLALVWGLVLPFVLPGVAMAGPTSSTTKEKAVAKRKGKPGEPGSGVPLKARRRSTDTGRLAAPLPKRPSDAADSEALDELEQLYKRYEGAHDSMADSLAQQLVIEAAEGRRALETHYEKSIRDHEAKARKMRAVAVTRYQEFLVQHPDDATWTPEVMFRLAELEFEGATDRLARQEEAFQKELEAYQVALEKNPDLQPPAGPSPDYAASIELYRDVVMRFPTYRENDGALYMMGTLLYEMENFDHSRQSYLALTCSDLFSAPLADGTNVVATRGGYGECIPWRADSAYVAEAWLRVGEIHYDFDELDPALEAYALAAGKPGTELYDEALFRIAATLWLKRDFAGAVARFDEFIRYADENKGKKEADGAVALRDQAVRYLAKTYLETDWDLDGREDRLSPIDRLDRDYASRGKERHVPEIYAALGDQLAEETDFAEAIRIWEMTLARWPLAATAPKIQLRVMQAWEALQDKGRAITARDRLATNYLRGTEWFYANEDDPDVIEEAMRIAEGALVATAVDHHAMAQQLRADGDPKAAEEYAIAAKAYAAYLERFPDTPSSYEYRYNYAESLFYSGQFLPAAEQYGIVRDSNVDDRLLEDSALGAVTSYERFVEDEKQAGRLTVPDMPKKGGTGPFDVELELPVVMVALQEAYDRFVAVRPDSEQAPSMQYLAGEVSQRFNRFGEAQPRFEKVVEEHCDDNVSIKAGIAIIDAQVVRDDLKAAQEWTDKLLEKGCGEGEAKQKFAGDLKTIGNAVRFQEATMLLDAGEFEAAADRYVALVDQAPDDPNADRALNNAAVAYETIGRFQSASSTYEKIYKNYPDSEFADDALLRTGFNHSRFFEFDEAVARYLVLAEDERYKESEHRTMALKNAASLLDNLQEYKRSADMYQRYATKTEDKNEAAEATFRAAEVLAKTDDHKKTIAAFQEFVGRFGTEPGQSERVVESKLRMGQAYAAMSDRRTAETYYRDTVATFEQRGLQPATDAADFPAEAQFLLAEYALSDVMSAKLTSTGKKLDSEAKALFDRLLVAAKEYDKVFPYRRIDWVLAAMFRRGAAFEETTIRVRDAPVPKKLKPFTEPWFFYKDLIDGFASRTETKAIELYEETVRRGQEFNIANEWTRRARERLNIYKPEEYPLLRRPALDLEMEDRR